MRAAVALVLMVTLAACANAPTEPISHASSPSSASHDGSLKHRQPTRETALLDWSRVGYPRSAQVWTNGSWTLAVSDGPDRWVDLRGPSFHQGWDVPDQRHYVDGVWLDDDWAAFGTYRRLNDRELPPVYTVVNLASGQITTIDQSSLGKPAWTEDYLHGQLLVSVRRQGRACLGYVDLATVELSDGPCPEPGRLFGSAQLTDIGLSAGQFDPDEDLDGRSFSCVAQLDLSATPPVRFPGTRRCWPRSNAMLVTGGYLWSQPTRPPDIASSYRTYAVSGDTRYDLGLGQGAIWCAGAAYFAQEARPAHPAEVVRWDGDGILTAVYRANHTGNLGAIWCAGDHIVLQSSYNAGAPQLTASLSE